MTTAREIAEYIVAEYLPGTPVEELDHSLDLFDNGVITSLRLLQFIEWLRGRYDIAMEDIDFSPEHFRSVNSIHQLVLQAKQPTPTS